MAQSLTALYLQNPALANALRKREQAGQMMQAGADYSPIQSPWQGLSRLAQALVGGYDQGQADKEIKVEGDRQSALEADLFAPMGQVPQQPMAAPQPMTASRQPVAQQALAPADYEPLIQQASRDTGIPAHILTAYFGGESSFRPDARNPRSTATGIGQVLDSTAADPGYGLPPLSAEARLDPKQAIPWVARYMAARGAALGATDYTNPAHVGRMFRAVGENTPEYEQRMLRSAGFGGQMQPPAQGGETIPAQMPGQGAPQGGPPQPRTPDAAQHYMAQAQEYQQRAQRALAARRPDLAGIFQQQAQMAQQMALARAPQPDETQRLLLAAGLQPGTPEYQQAARDLLAAKVRGPSTNVTTYGGATYGAQPPTDHRYVRRPLPDGGETMELEVIPGSPTARKLADAQKKEGKRDESTARSGNIVVEDIDRIGKLVDTSVLPTTGLGATFLSSIPGTASADVSKLLDGIRGNIAFDKLAQMRSESPTGAALGAVSDREMALLQSVYGSLEQSQSAEQFKQNLTRLRKIYMDIIHGEGKWTETAPSETTPTSGGGERPPLSSFGR